jgi:hypothetical protein
MLKRELEWINAPQKARQAKSKARVDAYEVCVCALILTFSLSLCLSIGLYLGAIERG